MKSADPKTPAFVPQRCGTLVLAAALGLTLAATAASAGVAVLGSGSAISEFDHAPNAGVHEIQAQQDPSARAREQAYIGRLEEQIRRLTGRIEQLEYEQRNTDRRFDQLVEDLDQRLSAIEGDGAGGLAAGAPGDERDRAEQALKDLAATGSGDQSAAGDQSASGDGQLGSVPESALAGLPRPDPADVAAPETSTLTPEQQYENAVQLLQAGDYQGAQGGLELFLDLNGDHQLASNAAYWLAETHYVRQNYSASAAAFARNYRTYGKDSSKAIDNLLKLGMSLSNLGEQDKACLTYDELVGAFPQRPAHIQQALSRNARAPSAADRRGLRRHVWTDEGAVLDQAAFSAAMARFEPFEDEPFLAIAVSGGADSLALTLLADGWARQRLGRVVGLTVDHGLRPGSNDEARQTGLWLADRGIEHHILIWSGQKPKTGLQQHARDARYALLADWCRQHGCFHLMTAHHRQDQAETVALRRSRKSGNAGLAAMAAVREMRGLRLLRPLLGVDKASLKTSCAAKRSPGWMIPAMTARPSSGTGYGRQGWTSKSSSMRLSARVCPAGTRIGVALKRWLDM